MCGVFHGVCFPNLGVLRPCSPGSGETSACDGTWWTNFLFIFACTKQGFLTFPLLILSPIHLQSSLCTHHRLRSNFARVQSWLTLIGSRHLPRTFSAALVPAHQPQHWCKRLFLGGWISCLSLLNFLLALLGHFYVFTSFPKWQQLSSNISSFPQIVVIREPAEGVRCGSLNYWNTSLKRGCDISAKTGGFQSLYWISPSATWFNFQVKCYSDTDYLLGSSHYLSYWCKQKSLLLLNFIKLYQIIS